MLGEQSRCTLIKVYKFYTNTTMLNNAQKKKHLRILTFQYTTQRVELC